MAYQASDGTKFTNRPSMKAHEARSKAAKLPPQPPASPEHEEQEKGLIEKMGNMHGMTCPSCGYQFEAPSEEQGSAQEPPAVNVGA